MKEVSLYIPSYNSGRTISLCLEAVLKQTYPVKEVLVIDATSGDEIVGKVSAHAARVVRQKGSGGLAAARNIAIRNINTEFVASVDADCVVDSDWLEQIMKRFDSPETAGVGGKLLEEYSSTACDLWRSVHMKQHWGEEENKPPFLFGSNAVFRKEALINIGFYNEEYKNSHEDVDISNRLKEKGYALIYEPRAIAHHFKNDNICSILNNFWKWNCNYYRERKYYLNTENFIIKLEHNIGVANDYIEEDFRSFRYRLLYLDFLLPLHHSLRDFEYFIYQECQNYPEYSRLSSWLSMLDLAFFYRFDYKNNSISTLAPQKLAFLQNFFVLNLILATFLQYRFKSSRYFINTFYRHLFLSVYNIEDKYMLDKLLGLATLRQDWSGLLKKKHANLNNLFLRNMLLKFQHWLDGLMLRFPNIMEIIEDYAKRTDEVVLKGGGCHDESE